MKSYYEDELGLPPEVTSYYDPIMASVIGFGCDALSAHWGHYFNMPGFRKTESLQYNDLHSFPGGNAGMARHFVKKLNPDAIDGSAFEDANAIVRPCLAYGPKGRGYFTPGQETAS